MKQIKRAPSFGKSCISGKYKLMLLYGLAVCLLSLQTFAGNAGEKAGEGYFQLLVTGKIVNESGTPLAGGANSS